MTDREKLIEVICAMGICSWDWAGKIADHLLSNGATFTPAIPGPSDEDPNIMELCFHNGEQHMKEKVILLLDAFDKDYTLGDPFIEYDKLRKAMMDL